MSIQIKGDASAPLAITDLVQIASNPKTKEKGGGDFIRFSEAKGIYTHQGISLSAIKDAIMGTTKHMSLREEKKQEGAKWIKNAIDDQYGAGTADKIFKEIKAERDVDLNMGVRVGDMRAVGEKLRVLDEFKKISPRAMEIAENGRVSGSDVIKEAFPTKAQPELGLAAKPRRPLTERLNETAQATTEKARLEKIKGMVHKEEPEAWAKLDLASNVITDLRRMDFNLHVPEVTDEKGTVQIKEYSSKQNALVQAGALAPWVDQLVKLTGSTQAAAVLGNMCQQNCLNIMYSEIPTTSGKAMWPMLAPKIEGQTITNLQNEKEKITPTQYGGAKIDLTKNLDGDFEINIKWDLYIVGFKNTETGEQIRAPLEPNDTLQLHMKTKWVIDGKEAQKGNTVVTAEPVVASFHGKLALT